MAARRLLRVLAYAGFVSLGLPDTVLGVAWPTLRDTFRLSQAAMGEVLAAGMWLQIALFFTYTGLEASAGSGASRCCASDTSASRRPARGPRASGPASSRDGSQSVSSWTASVPTVSSASRPPSRSPVPWCSHPATAVSRVGLLVMAAALAPVYPTLMARTPARLGAATSVHAIGFQVSGATLAAAALPAALGVLASRVGLGAVAPAVAGVALVFLALHELLLRVTPRGGR